MLAVIEGPDGAGKTTLINALRRDKRLHFWVLYQSRPPDTANAVIDLLNWVSRRSPHQHLVMDRHPAISEPIYGPIFRGTNLLHGFNNLLMLRDVDLFVYCRPSLEAICAAIEKTRNEQMKGVPDHILKLVEAYDTRFAQLDREGKNVFRYDYTIGDEPENVAQALIRTVRETTRD